MDFRVGIVITSLLLGTVQPDPSSHACTRFTDLSEPCGCILSPETFGLICGSDGHTYLNVCFLECQKAIDKVDIKIDYIGVCAKESRCSCRAEYDPKCGSNGVTYSNECVLNCFMKKDGKIRLKHVGECSSEAEQRLSDVVYKDTPGTCRCRSKLRSYYTRFGDNGQGYARSRCGCRAKQDKLNVQVVQTVQPAIEPVNRPSCDIQTQHGNSRPNEDPVQKLNLEDSNKCVCAAMHKPVCGSNQRTYANFCVLYCSSKKDPSVKLRHWGDCSNTQ